VTAPASPPASPPVADEHDRVSNEDAPAPALELAAVPVLEAEGGLNLRGAGGVEDVARESGRPLTSGDDGEGGPVEMATINPNILPAEHWVQQVCFPPLLVSHEIDPGSQYCGCVGAGLGLNGC